MKVSDIDIIGTWHFVLSLTPCISTRSPLWVWVGLRDNVLSSVPAALLWISPMPFICGNSLVGQQNLGPVSKCMLNVSSLLFCCHPIFSFGRCKYQLKLAELHDYCCCAQIVWNFSGHWTQPGPNWAGDLKTQIMTFIWRTINNKSTKTKIIYRNITEIGTCYKMA